MSELINKLARQAFEPINAISSEGVADWYTFNHTWFQLYNKRFAELIVRECADIAYEYDAPKLSGPGMIIAGRLEEHFGVEE